MRLASSISNCALHVGGQDPSVVYFRADDPAYDRALQRLAPEAGSIPMPTPIAALKPHRMSDEDRAALSSRNAVAEKELMSVDVSREGGGEDDKASIPLLTHPRSDWLRSKLADPVEDFKAIARVRLKTLDLTHTAVDLLSHR